MPRKREKGDGGQPLMSGWNPSEKGRNATFENFFEKSNFTDLC